MVMLLAPGLHLSGCGAVGVPRVQPNARLKRYWKVVGNICACLWRHEEVRYNWIDDRRLTVRKRSVVLKKATDIGGIRLGRWT